MNEKQKQILKLLWEFQSLRENQILKICKCTEVDINYLIANRVIIKEKNTKILRYNGKEINSRNIAAFDVVMEYLERRPKLKKGKYPISVSMEIEKVTYDIIAIKEIEINTLFEKIDEISKSDKVIVIIESKEYLKKAINTKRPCCICVYPNLKIVDMIN